MKRARLDLGVFTEQLSNGGHAPYREWQGAGSILGSLYSYLVCPLYTPQGFKLTLNLPFISLPPWQTPHTKRNLTS